MLKLFFLNQSNKNDYKEINKNLHLDIEYTYKTIDELDDISSHNLCLYKGIILNIDSYNEMEKSDETKKIENILLEINKYSLPFMVITYPNNDLFFLMKKYNVFSIISKPINNIIYETSLVSFHKYLLIKTKSFEMNNSLPGGVLIFSLEKGKKIHFVNNELLEELGYDKDELERRINNDFKQIFIEEDRLKLIDNINKTILNNNQSKKVSIYRIICKDNVVKWFYTISKIEENQKGIKLISLIAMTYEDKKKLVTKLNDEITKTKEIVTNSPIGLITFTINQDNDYECEYISDQMGQLFEMTPQDIVYKLTNQHFFNIYYEDLDLVTKSISEAIKNFTNINIEYRIIVKDGNIKWVELRAKQMTCSDGKRRLFCAFIDRTSLKDALDLLKQDDENFKTIMESVKISTWLYRIDSHSFHWIFNNDKSLLALATSSNELSDSYSEYEVLNYDTICEESIDDYNETFELIRKGQKIIEKTLKFRTIDGEYQWHKIVYITQFENNKPVGALGYSLDVTDIVNKEKIFQNELINLEEMHSDNIIDKGRINLTKNIIEDYTSYSGERITIIGEKYEKVIQSIIDRVATEEQKNKLMVMLSSYNLSKLYKKGIFETQFEYQRIIFKNQDPKWAELKIRLYENPQTSELNAFIYSFDIEEQRQLSILTKKLFNVSYNVVGILNIKDGLIHIYQKDNSIIQNDVIDCKYSDGLEYLASQCDDDFTDKEDFLTNLTLENVILNLKNNQIYTISFLFPIKGTTRRLKFEYSYLDELKNKIIYRRSDITTEYQLALKQRNSLIKALDDAKKANNAKNDFLSTMSHDIRTPMNAIINMTKLAMDDYQGISNGNVMDDLNKILTSSDFLLGLINDILDISRIESGKLELKPEVYEYNDFLSYISCIFEPLCQKKNISFIWDKGSTNLPIYVDKIRFNQIFFNLLSNAIKYTDEGGKITYSVNNNYINGNLLHCDFIIKDTGCGMSEDFQKKMFDPFEREYNNINSSVGTGLGLAIVKKIVDAMGGKIEVYSKINKGTIISLSLEMPLATPEQIKLNIEKRNKTIDLKVFNGKHILTVEDNELNRIVIKRILESKGIIVTEAVNGMEALDILVRSKENEFDLVLMDIRMPVLDGIKATEYIRNLTRNDLKNIPIIAMTADAFTEDMRNIMDSGMNDHLSKPIDKDLLFLTITKYLKK